MEEKPTLPTWVTYWLAGLVTYLLVGQSLDLLAPSFADQAKEYISYGLGLVTGVFIKR